FASSRDFRLRPTLLFETSGQKRRNLSLSAVARPCLTGTTVPSSFPKLNTSRVLSLTQYAIGLPGIFLKSVAEARNGSDIFAFNSASLSASQFPSTSRRYVPLYS